MKNKSENFFCTWLIKLPERFPKKFWYRPPEVLLRDLFYKMFKILKRQEQKKKWIKKNPVTWKYIYFHVIRKQWTNSFSELSNHFKFLGFYFGSLAKKALQYLLFSQTKIFVTKYSPCTI